MVATLCSKVGGDGGVGRKKPDNHFIGMTCKTLGAAKARPK